MKKILAVALTLIIAFAAVGCADQSAAYVAMDASGVFAEFDYNAELTGFVGADKNKDRTSFSDASKEACEYIFTRLSEIDGATVTKQDYTVDIATVNGTVSLSSTNVIATYNPGKEKRVAIFAHYDNMFGAIEAAGITGNGSSGIADNATGVITLISLVNAFSVAKPELNYTIDFVFTGSDEYGFSGTAKYLTTWKRTTDDILLAINLETIVGNKINVYSDVVSTVQQKIFTESGKNYGTEFSAFPKSSPVLPVGLTGASEYSDYGQLSGAAEFISRNIPVVSLFGWNINEFGYYTPEADKFDETSDFVALNPEYATAAKDAAALVYGAITDSRFTAASEKFTSGEGYGFFNGGYFAYLAYLGLIIILCVVLIIVVKKLTKKHGSDGNAPKPQSGKVKIAVFGPEYEDASNGDVIVDIRDKNEDNDPFSDNDN